MGHRDFLTAVLPEVPGVNTWRPRDLQAQIDAGAKTTRFDTNAWATLPSSKDFRHRDYIVTSGPGWEDVVGIAGISSGPSLGHAVKQKFSDEQKKAAYQWLCAKAMLRVDAEIEHPSNPQ